MGFRRLGWAGEARGSPGLAGGGTAVSSPQPGPRLGELLPACPRLPNKLQQPMNHSFNLS